MNRMFKRVWLPLLPLAAIALVAVYFVTTGTDYESFVEEHGHAHAHEAPHGGTLIVLGMHTAHVELVFDEETGRLDFYALDADAQNLYSLPAEPFEIAVRTDSEAPWEEVSLAPVEIDEEHRPTVARAFKFSAVVTSLQGKARFEVRLPDLELAGASYDGLTTSYPEGNH